jgi:hypothetical protein
MTSTSRRPAVRYVHRAGPVEVDEAGHRVQTCLRCDRVVFLASKDNPTPFRLGKRVYLNVPCPGKLDDPW